MYGFTGRNIVNSVEEFLCKFQTLTLFSHFVSKARILKPFSNSITVQIYVTTLKVCHGVIYIEACYFICNVSRDYKGPATKLLCYPGN